MTFTVHADGRTLRLLWRIYTVYNIYIYHFCSHARPFLACAQKYKDLEGEVTRKDGIILLRELASEVKNFMDFKMNAVMVSFNHFLLARARGLVFASAAAAVHVFFLCWRVCVCGLWSPIKFRARTGNASFMRRRRAGRCVCASKLARPCGFHNYM